MSNGSNVPATALSRIAQAWPATTLAIGQNEYYPQLQSPDQAASWFIIVDLTSLNVVQNVITTDGTTVPAAVSQYTGNAQYFLYFVTNVQPSYNLPQGALYAFLQQVGSGTKLTTLEQMIEQLGTGTLLNFSYVLAATMATDDMPGFEAFDVNNSAILTMQFMPVTVNGKTIYAPIQVGA